MGGGEPVDRIAPEIIAGLREFADALKAEPGAIESKFACRTVAGGVEPAEYTPQLVRQSRAELDVSQTLFARFLGVAPSTVRAWEQGRTRPRDAACRLMDEIRHDPDYWRRRIQELLAVKTGD